MNPSGPPPRPIDSGLSTLMALATLHEVAVDEAQLRHQFGDDPFDTARILLAAQSLGLTAKAVKQKPDRLDKAPLPAIAQDQSNGQYFILGKIQENPDSAEMRILIQRPGTPPEMWSLDELLNTWTGELIFITSKASYAGAMAKFDFTWFIPAIIKYRKLLGEVLLISLVLQLHQLTMVKPMTHLWPTCSHKLKRWRLETQQTRIARCPATVQVPR